MISLHKISKTLSLVIIVFAINSSLISQTTVALDDILSVAKRNALDIKIADANVKVQEHQWAFYKAQTRPQVGLNITAPDYFKSSVPVTQPDGIISFTDLSQNNASISLGLSQVIPQTGGRVFINTDLRRFDDFPNDITAYNGVPFQIGIDQPIFGFNGFKHDKRILTMQKEELRKSYNNAVEATLSIASQLFFNILIAKENQSIATTNRDVNEKLLAITKERFDLGKVSKSDVLQLEMELKNAALNVSQATFDLEQSILAISAYLHTNYQATIHSFIAPNEIPAIRFDHDLAIQKATQNRPEYERYLRQTAELKRDKALAKANFGVQANLQASFGYAKGGNQIADIYSNPKNAQTLQMTINLPLIDWGRKRAALGEVAVKRRLVDYQFQQDQLNIKAEVTTTLFQLKQLKEATSMTKSIATDAQERFKISNDRYTLGNISITDLTIAQREKDQAQRNYMVTLGNFWSSYYTLRAMTGYDPITNKSIEYILN